MTLSPVEVVCRQQYQMSEKMEENLLVKKH